MNDLTERELRYVRAALSLWFSTENKDELPEWDLFDERYPCLSEDEAQALLDRLGVVT